MEFLKGAICFITNLGLLKGVTAFIQRRINPLKVYPGQPKVRNVAKRRVPIEINQSGSGQQEQNQQQEQQPELLPLMHPVSASLLPVSTVASSNDSVVLECLDLKDRLLEQLRMWKEKPEIIALDTEQVVDVKNSRRFLAASIGIVDKKMNVLIDQKVYRAPGSFNTHPIMVKKSEFDKFDLSGSDTIKPDAALAKVMELIKGKVVVVADGYRDFSSIGVSIPEDQLEEPEFCF